MTALVLALVAAWWAARPATPDAFYTPVGALPGQPGMLLKQEAFERRVPAGVRAWRILYTTTRAEGVPAVASAIVMLAGKAAPAAHPVVAWTHGTTGVMPGCAPSLLDDPFANVPALQPLLDQGYAYVATDYVGQGTPGPHPYLIGEGQARSALDSVRAARQMQGLMLDERTVVWGHSQGGNAALWTGILAPRYAPDVKLAGVAALAPASDLLGLIDTVQHTPVGRIMSSYVLEAYSSTYPEVSFTASVPLLVRPLAYDMAGRCLAGRKALFSAVEALATGGSIFGTAPTQGALGKRLAQNTPAQPIASPVLLAQGQADDLVLPPVQARFVERRCAEGQVLEFKRYEGRDHLSLVAPDSPLIADLMRWTQARFAGTPAPSGCPASG